MGAREKSLAGWDLTPGGWRGVAPPPSEREVLAQVRQWLDLHRFFWWRNNVGGRKLPGHGGKGQFVRWGVEGSGDLFLLLAGRFVSVECKKAGGRVRPGQAEWMRKVRAAGGAAAVVHSVGELEAFLRSEGWAP